MPGLRIVYPLVASDRASVEADAPAWYPVESLETASARIWIEGRIYRGRPELVNRVESIGSGGVDDSAFAAQLRACVESGDGDFVVACLGRSDGRLGVADDRFGRLPVYYHASESRVVVARDQGFVLAHVDAPVIDHTALAQALLFGFPLRSRTLIAGAHRLLPGEVLVVSPRGSRVVPAPASPFRRGTHAPRTAAACATALRGAFVAACRDRHLDAHDHVLSLSGGIDSRTVGAGMRAAFDAFSAVTFVAPGSSHADERELAARVARVLNADWRAYEFDHVDPASIDGIIRLKLGLNPVDVAFGLEYVRRVQADHANPVALWTGEGADKLLCEHRAIPPHPSTDELVRFIVEKNAVFDPASVRALTGVHEDDVLESVRAAVLAAGDIEPEDAYIHFLLAERVVRWHTEGEDRHRTHVWTIAPFFAREFVALARAIPGRWKHGRRVYRAFLRALAPDVAQIPLAGGHAPPASLRFAAEYAVRETLRNNRHASSAHAHLRRRRASARIQDDPWRERLAALRDSNGVPAHFDPATIENLLAARAPASSYAFAVLLTAVLAVRRIERDARNGRA